VSRYLVAILVLHPWLLVGWTARASAWEIELRERVASEAAVLRLGDIGAVSGLPREDGRRIEQVVLAPGPSRAYSRSLSASQIRRLLLARGVDLAACRFSGAVRVLIVHGTDGRTDGQSPQVGGATVESTGAALPVGRSGAARPASYARRDGAATIHGVQEKLAAAVSESLARLSDESAPWHVDVRIAGRALREVPPQWHDLTIEGLELATEGRHRLVACFAADAGDIRIPVEADALRKVQLVVPLRPLKRGELIGENDVALKYVMAGHDPQSVAGDIHEVLNQQVQLPMRAGEPVRKDALKKPVLVTRRDEVEVVARRGGITIRTKARAIDQGSLDDIITIEKLDGSRDRLVARVVGFQEVAVCVSGASATRMVER